MKVLVTVFDIQDYGGIIQHTELLMRGLRELGHEVTFRILRNADRPSYRTAGILGDEAWQWSAAGDVGKETNSQGEDVMVSQKYGWRRAIVQCYGGSRLAEYRALANSHDLVLHELPVPKPDPEGYWLEMYRKIKPPQIAIAHDAHYRTLYPHMLEIAKYLTGVACTNHAGYRALEYLPVPRAFVASGHVPRNWKAQPAWGARQRRFVSAHIWKRWKHMDLVLRAIPHLTRKTRHVIGGDGIERRYMTSKDKCRDAYKDLDKPIWDKAILAGMKWRGDMKQEDLLIAYEDSRLMVDMSFSKKFAALGNHFNRSTFDAYNGGCVPLCTAENMAEQEAQVKLFEGGETHLEIGAKCSPLALANMIDMSLDMEERTASRIIRNGRELLTEKFHYLKSAEAYLLLAKGKGAGIYPKLETGKAPPEFRKFATEFLKSAVTPEE